MRYVSLGSTGLHVSELCFGTMTFGKEADLQASTAIYRRCREAGINFFDCANVYSRGEAERILGGLVAGERDRLILTSKVGGSMGDGPNQGGLSRRTIVYECEQSLRRLQTDWIDVYFAHRFDPTVPLEDVLRAFDALVAQGKIRYFGVSNWAAWQIAQALGVGTLKGLQALRVIQPMYNVVKRQAEVELFPLAQDAGLGVMVYNPLGGGILTGKYGPGRTGPGRLAESDMYRRRYAEDWMFQAAEGLKVLAAEVGLSPVSLAIGWAARHPAVSCPIVGARTVEQLEPALVAPQIQWTDELHRQMRALAPSPPPATDRTDDLK